MREVVLVQLGRDVALKDVGVLRRAVEIDLVAGIGAEGVAELPGQLGEVLVGEDEREPVAAGLGEHLLVAAWQREEVLRLVDVQGRVDTGALSLPGAGGRRLPDLGDDEGAEKAGRLLAEDARR